MRILTFVFSLLLATQLYPQSRMSTRVFISSEVLGREVQLSVYLPDGYDSSDRDYPILYLLHGFTGDHQDWIQFGEMQQLSDHLMKNGEVTPMVIVMPDADNSWYIDNYDGSIRYETFFIKELIPEIEKRYRVRSEKQFRAIAGLSMGGHGALFYGVKYPELFSSVGALSASIRTAEELEKLSGEQWNRLFAETYGSLQGDGRITPHLKQNNVIHFIESADSKTLSSLSYYIDCGDDDHLIECNMRLHELLLEKAIPHEFRVRDGAHSWDYWRTGLPEVLRFVSDRFHR